MSGPIPPGPHGQILAVFDGDAAEAYWREEGRMDLFVAEMQKLNQRGIFVKSVLLSIPEATDGGKLN